MVIINRETLHRPGPHPHRSAHASFDPHFIFIFNPSLDSSSPESEIITNYHQTTASTEKGASMSDQDHVETQEVSTSDIADRTMVSRGTTLNASSGMDRPRPVTRSSGRLVDWAEPVDDQLMDEAVLQISGAGHWFLEGWIGDHSVDFLVDSGSAVTLRGYITYRV